VTTDPGRQFSKTAQAYLTSATHASGADLQALVANARPTGQERLLDVGSNVGHTLRALAEKVSFAVGVDVASDALRLNRSVTTARNVALVEADTVALPFADGTFDLVTCRLAAHHFGDAPAAYREIARVLSPSGRLLMIDNYAPDDPALDVWINDLERLRDASHVRERTLAEELALLDASGLRTEVLGRFGTPLQTEDWLARSQTPEGRAARVRQMLATASVKARETFRVAPDGSAFDVPKALIAARRT
jgi:ubiquinone/menaquinone biosynthesis C-methylase UbiE